MAENGGHQSSITSGRETLPWVVDCLHHSTTNHVTKAGCASESDAESRRVGGHGVNFLQIRIKTLVSREHRAKLIKPQSQPTFAIKLYPALHGFTYLTPPPISCPHIGYTDYLCHNTCTFFHSTVGWP